MDTEKRSEVTADGHVLHNIVFSAVPVNEAKTGGEGGVGRKRKQELTA